MRLLIPILFISVQCFSQEMSCTSGSAQIQKVIEMPGKSAADIYKLANRWVAKSFHNKDKVIQSTIENELIRGDGFESGVIKMGLLTVSDLSYTFTIDIKEEKLRFTMNGMKVHNETTTYSAETYCCKNDGSIRSNGQSQKVKAAAEGIAKQLIESLNSMQNEKGSDW